MSDPDSSLSCLRAAGPGPWASIRPPAGPARSERALPKGGGKHLCQVRWRGGRRDAMDGSGSGRNVRGVRNEWWVKRKLSLLVKSMPLSLICTRAGHVALIPGTEEFFIALSDHPEWGTSHAVWGEIEDWFATDFIAAHDYKESKHPDYGRHHSLADGLKSSWTGSQLASARGACASVGSLAASSTCAHCHAFRPRTPPVVQAPSCACSRTSTRSP